MKTTLIGLLFVIVSGCSSAAPPPTATPPALLAERTPWQNEMANLESDGTRSLSSALTLFAMAFGPFPGVSTAATEVGTVGSASPAVRAVHAHRDQLTAEQIAAIDQHLVIPDDARTIDIPAASTPLTAGLPSALNLNGVAATLPPFDSFEQDLRELGERARSRAAYYFGELPNRPDGSTALSIRTTYAPSEPFLTFFNPVFGSDGFKCDVIVNREHAGVSMGQTARSLTLDVTHCFQSWRMGTEQGFDGNVPAWAWDGPAEYIMLESVPVQEDDALWWATYLLLPDVPLFERSYDAIGYYSQAWEAGVDLGQAFVAVLTDVDNPERFALAETASNAFLDKWASEHVRTARGDWGRDWEFLGPGLITYTPQTAMQPMTVSNGSLEAFSQDAYSNHLFAVHSTADIVKVEAMGRARVGDGSVDVVIPGSAYFCTTDKGCGPCPDGSDPSIQPTSLSPDSVLAVSGGTDGTNGTVSGHPLEEFCDKTPPPTAPPSATPPATPDPDPDPDPNQPGEDACDDGCPMSNGDPHMVTINNLAYDFMAAGEFVLLRSGDGTFELQARQEPVDDSTYVSGTTAIAMRVGPSRVAILTDLATNELSVTVDGDPADVSSPVAVGGGQVNRSVDGIEVTFPDASRLIAHGSHEFGISLTLIPSDDLRASGTGLLGPISRELFGLPALPDGTVLPPPQSYDDYQNQVYGPFEDAWRVTAETSLFDYAPGTTTASYTLPDFPVFEDIMTIEDFPADALGGAEAACFGLGNVILTAQCIYDVLVTGNEGFADVYEQTATIVESGALPSTGARARVVNLYSENGQPVDLDVYAWTYSSTEMTEVAALVATVAYGQASDWFNPGLIEAPYSVEPHTRVTVERRGEAPDPISPLGAMGEFLGPGTVTTISIWQEEVFEGEPDAWIQATYAEHPDYETPRAPAGQSLLITRNSGLLAEDDPPTLHASVGEGCLIHPLSDPAFPTAQPVANEMVLPPGDHTLTLHNEPFGEIPSCVANLAGPGVPISAAEGDRLILFAYRLPGATEVSQLVLPFD